MAKVKVLHALLRHSRRTTIEHAVCFARHPYGNQVEFANAFGPVSEKHSDLLIVTYDLLALRNTPYWKSLRKIIISQAALSSKTICFPQDDYSSCAVLDDLFVSIPNCTVYTPIVNDLPILYPKATQKRIRFYEALTGYVDENMDSLASKFSRPFESRSIDVGQRVRYLPPQFGLEAQKKGRIAVEFAELASKNGFLCDVSTDISKVLLGENWHRFLGDSKFTVGGLGGASLADPKGRLADRIRRKTFRNPELTIDDLNRTFSSRGGRNGDFTAISPRIFEAAALGVCQILFKANYVGRLNAWEHYIPLKPDLSNAADVLDFMRDTDSCAQIARKCKEELIGSGDFTYDKFVHDFWQRELGQVELIPRDLPFLDSINEMQPLFSKGLQFQELAANQVRSAFIQRRSSRNRSSFVGFGTEEFAANEIEAIGAWVHSLKTKKVILESVLIDWSPVSGSGWLDSKLEQI